MDTPKYQKRQPPAWYIREVKRYRAVTPSCRCIGCELDMPFDAEGLHFVDYMTVDGPVTEYLTCKDKE